MNIGRCLIIYALVFSLVITVFSSVIADEGTGPVLIPPSEYPIADFTWSPNVGNVYESVYFQDRSFSGDGAVIVNRSWDFGDGNISYQRHPTHIYTKAGSYNVTLTVLNSFSLYDSCEKVVNINQPPVANADGPYTQTDNNTIHFNGSKSFDPDGYIVTYEWDFGDGGTGTGVYPIYTYSIHGNYTVTLTVMDNHGSTDTDTTFVNLKETDGEHQHYLINNFTSSSIANSLLTQVLQRFTQILKQRFSNSLILHKLESRLEVLSSLETTETASTQIEDEFLSDELQGDSIVVSSSSSSTSLESTVSNVESTSSSDTTESSSSSNSESNVVVDSDSSSSSSSVESERYSDDIGASSENNVVIDSESSLSRE
jgi:PKD repeat protein